MQSLERPSYGRGQSVEKIEELQGNFESLLRHIKRVNTQSVIRPGSTLKMRKDSVQPVPKSNYGVHEIKKMIPMPSLVKNDVEKIYGSMEHNSSHHLVALLHRGNSTYHTLSQQKQGAGNRFLRRNITNTFADKLLMSRYDLDLSAEEGACVVPDLPVLVNPLSPRSAGKVQTNMVLPNHIQVLTEFLKAIKDHFTAKFVRDQVLIQKTLFSGVY